MEIENTSVSENEVIEEEVIENEETEQEDSQEETIEESVEESAPDSPEDILGDEESTENIVDDAETVPGIEGSDNSSAIVDDTETVSGSDIGLDVSGLGASDTESVSGGDVYYITEVPEEPPIWEKPMKDYTVLDGLFLIFLVVCFFVGYWCAFWKER